jgi:ABC-type multidrug transport system ATPase subunit
MDITLMLSLLMKLGPKNSISWIPFIQRSLIFLVTSFLINMQIHNILQILGLKDCADTVVGDEMLRGVSGGQKRRVTVGEMLIPPKSIKFMDAVSNGLDASTTFDIFRALKHISRTLGFTACVSLLQVPFIVD